MLPGKLLISGILIAMITMNCDQLKPQSRKNSSQTKTVSKPVLKDSTNIFDEFYKDEAVVSAEKSTNEKDTRSATFSTEQSKSSVAPGQFAPNGKYVIQISAVKSKQLADKIAKQLKSKGFPAYTAEVRDPLPELAGTYYRIRIGSFATIYSANAFGKDYLKSAGYEFWVDKKSNDNIGAEGYESGRSDSPYRRTTTGLDNESTYYSKPNQALSSPVSSGSTGISDAGVSTTPVVDNSIAAPQNQPISSKEPASNPLAREQTPSAATTPNQQETIVPDTTGWGSAW